MYKIISYQVADFIDIKNLKSVINSKLLYSDSSELFYETKANSYTYIFRYGVVSFSNYEADEISSFLKFLAHRYRASPVRQKSAASLIPQTELCPACKKPMTELHKTSGRTIRVLWQCSPCNQSAWKTYVHESVRERR